MLNETRAYDVAIVGGGPAGSTVGSFLKKYRPELNVLILEREQFPRDHVGESQLPGISHMLNEMGCWDKIEAANFPIKVGATYLWGKTAELWDFDFVPVEQLVDSPRPGKFEGQRTHLAFQVDRAVYDDILLNHAQSLGCEVCQNVTVRSARVENDRVESLSLSDGRTITANHYLDCSGHSGILRRALEVPVEYPTALQNVAIWDYWRNAVWAEEIGIGGTRVQVMSVGYGWIWFIPLGPDRTSVGLVVPKEYLRSCRLTPRELFEQAIDSNSRIKGFMAGAVSEGKFQTTKDWSFVASRLHGPNWMLVGESAGFADPILAAGLTLTHAGAKEAAYTILEIYRGGDADWLKRQYSDRQIANIRTHIRFADYWYTANGQFVDLQDHVAQIARDNGLDLSPEKAWAWLAQGGFIDSEYGASQGTFSPEALIAIGEKLSELPAERAIERNNRFKLSLEGAARSMKASYKLGRVHKVQVFEREGKVWPLKYPFDLIYDSLQEPRTMVELLQDFRAAIEKFPPQQRGYEGFVTMTSFEALVRDGWIEASYDPTEKLMKPYEVNTFIHWHQEQTDTHATN